MIYEILAVSSIIIIAEIIYILLCREQKRSEIEDEWFNLKVLSFVMALIITGGLFGLGYALRKSFLTTILLALAVIGIVVFLYANYYIGMAVAKKR
jgi:hypothetical protein